MNLIIKATDQASTVLKGINGNVDKLDSKVKGASSKWGGMKTAIGAAALAAGAFAAVKIVGDKIDSMDELAKSARKAGAATSGEAFEGFQVLGNAMAEAGINTNTYERALLNVSTKLKMGTEGQKSFAKVTDKMGDSILTANGGLKTGPDLLIAMTNALNDGTINMEEFSKVVGGKAGPEIAAQFASLNTSAGDLEATLADVKANSNIVDLGAAENAEKFNDTVGRMKEQFGQLFTDALQPLMPVLVELADNILAALPGIIDTVSGALEKMKPLWKFIGVLFTDVIVPILGTLFDILGKVFDVMMPLYEKALPKLEKAIVVVKDTIQLIVDKITGAITAIVDFKNTISDMASGVSDKVSGMASAVTDKFDDMTGGMVSGAKDAVDGVLGFFGFMKNEAVDNSIIPDMIKAILGWFDVQKEGMITKTEEATSGVLIAFERNRDGIVYTTRMMAEEVVAEYTQMGIDIEDVMAKTKAKMRGDGVFISDKDLRKTLTALTPLIRSGMEFANFMVDANEAAELNNTIMNNLIETYDGTAESLNIATKAMAYFGIESDSALGKAIEVQNAISSGFQSMAGSIGDTFYDMFSGVVSVFDGLRNIAAMVFKMIAKAIIQTMIVKPLMAMMGFAQGGIASGGAPAIVGENGPELIVPSGNTRVFSNSQSKNMLSGNGGGEPLTVNFNINAVSTRDGVEFLIENKNIITGVIQEAYQTSGRAGPLG